MHIANCKRRFALFSVAMENGTQALIVCEVIPCFLQRKKERKWNGIVVNRTCETRINNALTASVSFLFVFCIQIAHRWCKWYFIDILDRSSIFSFIHLLSQPHWLCFEPNLWQITSIDPYLKSCAIKYMLNRKLSSNKEILG